TQQISAVVNINVYQPLPMTIGKKSVNAANPSKNKDLAQFSGSLTFASGTAKLPTAVTVQFGIYAQSFTLVKGAARSGSTQFRFSAKQKNGVLTSPVVAFKIKLAGNLLTVLTNAGLTLGKDGSVAI